MSLELRFRHEAFFYAGDAELVTAATHFIEDARATAEPVMVAVSGRVIARLQDELGGEPPGVFFVDMPTLGRNPARIIPAWRRFVAEHGPAAPGLRGIGEPIWAGRGPDELVECRHHEALLNLAFGSTTPADPEGTAGPDDPDAPDAPTPADATGPGTRFWLVCPYDTSALDPAVVDEARATHPFVHHDGTGYQSDRYEGVETVQLLDEPLPDPPGSAAELVFDSALARLRRFVADQVRRVAPDLLRKRPLLDIVLAVEEVGTNSVRYGGGWGVARIWREGDTLLCEVRDRGHLTDPLAGRHEPGEVQLGGRGLWMVNQLCDLLQLRSSPAGTTTRLHFRLATA